MLSQFLTIPNLFSLSRIFLTPFVAWFLAQDTPQATLLCIGLFIIAAITDFLDGYTARTRNEISRLGVALDPIADKLFAGIVVILLIFHRDLPVWLAAVILGRDLVIMAAGAALLRGRTISLPSNLTGKYTFSAIAVLLASYVVRFDWGITLFTWLTLLFSVLSLIMYTRVFLAIRAGRPIPRFRDRPHWKSIRIGLTLALSAWYLYRFWLDILH